MFSQSDAVISVAYPREYRASRFWKAAMMCCSLIFIGPGAVSMWLAINGADKTLHERILLAATGLIFASVGICMSGSAIKERVILFADHIVNEGVFSTKTVYLSELKGWRVTPTSPSQLVLEHKEDKRPRRTKVPLYFPLDDEFMGWLLTFPALDIADSEASAAEVFEDQRLGKTVTERSENLDAGLKRTRILNTVAMGASLWAIFYPRPYLPLMLLLVALPLAAVEMLRRSNGLVRVDEQRNDAHPNIALGFMFPSLILLFRAVLDFKILLSMPAFVWPVAVAAILTFLLVRFDPSLVRRKPIIAVIATICLAYGYGATIEINATHDGSADAIYSAIVQGKHIIHGKHISYNLELGPWGPNAGTDDLEVRQATYANIQPGDTVFLTVKTGILRVKWYYLRAWQPGPAHGPSISTPSGEHP